MNRRVWLSALLLVCTSLAHADDWPQFRGPDRTGISKETGLLKSWPKDGPPLVWSFKEAGLGFSSCAIVDGALYTLGTRGEDEVVLALDAKSGKELWTAKIGPIFTFSGNTWGDGPRSTPTVDGSVLYALGGQGELLCLDISQKGKEVWRKNLIKDFGGEMMTEWGYSESPLVDGDKLICTPGGPRGTLACLDKKTGALVWQSKDLTHKAPYSAPIVTQIHGQKVYIQNSYVDENTGGFNNGFDAKTGKLLWSYSIFKHHSYAIAPTPIVKDNLVYVTSGYGGGCHLLEVDPEFKVKDLYSKKAQKAVKNTHGGVVLIDGHIYGHTEPKAWVCQEMKSGAIAWFERDKFPCSSGTLIAAEGKLYLYTDEGEVALVEADPKAFNEISSFKIPELSKYPQMRGTSRSSRVWNHPVIANGFLFLRDNELIFCYDIRAKK